MGVMTQAEMREEVRFNIGGRSSVLGDLPDTNVNRWLQWANIHVGRPQIYPHRILQETGTFALTSAFEYPFTSLDTVTDADEFVATRSVMNISKGTRLVPRDVRQMDQMRYNNQGTAQEGEPRFYTLYGTDFQVWESPSSVYQGDTVQVRYWRKPATLSSTGVASELGEDWDEVIVQGATWRGFRALELHDRAELAKTEFGQLVNEVNDHLRLDLHDPGRIFELGIQPWQEPTPYGR